MRSVCRAFAEESRAILGDWGAFLILVGAIVIYAFFYPVPYSSQVLREIPIAVVDMDRSQTSRRLARMADAHELLWASASAASLGEAEDLVRAGKAGGILVIPEHFERTIRRGEAAHVAGYADAGYFLVYRQVLTGLLESCGTLSAGIEIRRLQGQGLPLDAAVAAREPLGLVSRPLFNAAEGYGTYVVPAVLVLILQQTLLVGIGLVGGTSRERSGQSRSAGPDRPVATPLAALARLTGRSLVYFLLYLVHLLFYFGVVFHLLGFSQRASGPDLLAFAAPFLLSVIFLGLAARSAFRTREMSMQVLLFTSLPAIFLAGFSWPAEAIPRWLVVAASVLPSTSAIPGFLRLSQMGATLAQVRAEWLFLWGLCGVYFLLAWAAEVRGPAVGAGEPRRQAPAFVPALNPPSTCRTRRGTSASRAPSSCR